MVMVMVSGDGGSGDGDGGDDDGGKQLPAVNVFRHNVMFKRQTTTS